MQTIYQKHDIQKLLSLDNETMERLETYHTLLLKWNKAINLVSPNTLQHAWHRHFADSMQITKYIPAKNSTMGTQIYADLGCGGGFPGLVLAIMHPDMDVHLIESDERKTQFMRTVARETQAKNVTLHPSRVESITQESEDFSPEFITARALASLNKLCDLCYPWATRNPDLQLCFLKGAKATDEIEQARARYDFDLQTHASITDDMAQILLIKNLRKKG